MKTKRIMNINVLEKYFEKTKESGHYTVWRIGETQHWYSIQVEIEGTVNASETVAYYLTDSWEEVINFCSSHYNPGYDTINGLGCTESELSQATIEYIHSLGKKARYE